MKIRELQDEIIRLKKEKNVCILAHSYQSREITEIADFVGDSFALSRKAQTSDADTVILCGVRFMAETAKILSPEKKVILSHKDAGCPMAEQMDKDIIEALKARNPGYAVVAYINTTAELKTVCDVCVTSSSALKIVRALDTDKIIFIPDCNLGAYIQKNVPEKEIMLVRGGCPTHARITEREVLKAKAAHPSALLLVHPECMPEVCGHADYIGSTSGITDYAKASDKKEFIIGTENSIVQHLSFDCPDKRFYPLSKDCVCHNMRLTTLPEVYGCLDGTAGEEIVLDEETIALARRPIDKMLELG
ncbi:MAG: quinolinate synthase NadA [Clostridia bacterium]|nr:quinolinate synthase NadA [Clostridia bacterium]